MEGGVAGRELVTAYVTLGKERHRALPKIIYGNQKILIPAENLKHGQDLELIVVATEVFFVKSFLIYLWHTGKCWCGNEYTE